MSVHRSTHKLPITYQGFPCKGTENVMLICLPSHAFTRLKLTSEVHHYYSNIPDLCDGDYPRNLPSFEQFHKQFLDEIANARIDDRVIDNWHSYAEHGSLYDPKNLLTMNEYDACMKKYDAYTIKWHLLDYLVDSNSCIFDEPFDELQEADTLIIIDKDHYTTEFDEDGCITIEDCYMIKRQGDDSYTIE